MKHYKIKYYYLATGMEGIPEEYPEKIIEAESRDKALYLYHTSNGIDFGTFDEFMNKEQYVREWGINCEEVNERTKKEQAEYLQELIKCNTIGIEDLPTKKLQELLDQIKAELHKRFSKEDEKHIIEVESYLESEIQESSIMRRARRNR